VRVRRGGSPGVPPACPLPQSPDAVRGPQDSAGAYPAYVVRYRRHLGAGPLEAPFPAPAGPDSLMARGEAAFRAQLQPVFAAAAAATAAAVAAAAGADSDAFAAAAIGDGGGGAAGPSGGAEGGGDPLPLPGAAPPTPQSPAVPTAVATPVEAAAVRVIDLTGED
jgi:hypothetical protein